MSQNPLPIRVLLADDHPVVRDSLRILLSRHESLQLVGEAATSREVLELAARVQPDIVVLDLCLLDGDSLLCLPQLKIVAPFAKVVAFTDDDDTDLPRRAVAAGVLGWVSKGEALETLLRAIECVHRGEVWLSRILMAEVLGQLTAHQTPTSNSVATSDAVSLAKIATLTPREREIIQLIGQGLKNKQMAARLFLSEKTIHSHLASIFQKLEVSDRLELAVFAHRHALLAPSLNSSATRS